MKKCCKCREEKPYSEFGNLKKSKDGYAHRCKTCDRATTAQWRENNREAHREMCRDWASSNRDLVRETNKKWRENNPHLNAAKAGRYRSSKLKATPPWLDEELNWMIDEIYQLSCLRTEMTGVGHHVDHIVPLQGEAVKGLHVPWNLQVITATDNLKKRNSLGG